MGLYLHAIANTCFPQPGGMESAIFRIVSALAGLSNSNATIYVFSSEYVRSEIPERARVRIVPLREIRPDLSCNGVHLELNQTEQFHLDLCSLKQAISASMAGSCEREHIAVSFFAGGHAFIAQEACTQLGIPHILSTRGSDIWRNSSDPFYHSLISSLVSRATYIVTTNKGQKEYIEKSFNVHHKIKVIYNSVTVSNTRVYPAFQLPRNSRPVRLFADCGFSFRKGTLILLDAFKSLENRGIQLTVCGLDDPGQQKFWTEVRRTYQGSLGSRLVFLPVQTVCQIEAHLHESDIYCSATLGEGCSTARCRALLSEKVIVSTRTGELIDFASSATHVFLSEPGDLSAFSRNLNAACDAVEMGGLFIDKRSIERAAHELSQEREIELWQSLIKTVSGVSPLQT
jgi:glycosyltransferase involved in cell wall biosynthesis